MNVGVIDDGYGDIKFINHLGKTELIPSFITDFKEKPVESLSNNYQQNKSYKYLACEFEGMKYVIGDYAMKLSKNIWWNADENKHDDYRFPIILKTVLGMMSKEPIISFDTLMMNLPISYNTDERVNKLKGIVEGEHDISISLEGKDFFRKKIYVNNLEVKKQPFGSLCDALLNEEGEIIDKSIAKGFNVVIDIGSRTLNILTVDSLEEVPTLTKQTNDGMYSAYIQVGDYLENNLSVTIPDGKLPLIIKEGEIKGTDIVPLVDRIYSNHANVIMNIVNTLFLNSWAFVDNVIFTGGGAEALRSYLPKVKGVNTIFLGRFSNAKGLRKYGIRQSKKRTKRTTMTAQIGSRRY